MEIPARYHDTAMAHILLDAPQVHAIGQPKTGGGVPQEMGSRLGLVDTSTLQQSANHHIEHGCTQGFALVTEKQGICCTGHALADVEPELQGILGRWWEQHQALFVPLANNSDPSSVIPVEIGQPKGNSLLGA